MFSHIHTTYQLCLCLFFLSLFTPNWTSFIGREGDPAALKRMIAESPGQLNFTHFLSLFGEKLHGKVDVSVCVYIVGGVFVVNFCG